MRMRRKRNLEDRLNACRQAIVRMEGLSFYEEQPQNRFDIIDLTATFSNNNPLALEIGCGKGGFALQFAKKYPNVNLIAVEKLSNVIVEACEKAIANNLPQNLRFINSSAENLHYFLSPHSVETIYLNFSCPYPKKAYANRRLTNPRFLDLYKTLLSDNGTIIQKTDNSDFFAYSTECLLQGGFEIIYHTTNLYAEDTSDNIATEYEQKFTSQNKPICKLIAKVKN